MTLPLTPQMVSREKKFSARAAVKWLGVLVAGGWCCGFTTVPAGAAETTAAAQTHEVHGVETGLVAFPGSRKVRLTMTNRTQEPRHWTECLQEWLGYRVKLTTATGRKLPMTRMGVKEFILSGAGSAKECELAPGLPYVVELDLGPLFQFPDGEEVRCEINRRVCLTPVDARPARYEWVPFPPVMLPSGLPAPPQAPGEREAQDLGGVPGVYFFDTELGMSAAQFTVVYPEAEKLGDDEAGRQIYRLKHQAVMRFEFHSDRLVLASFCYPPHGEARQTSLTSRISTELKEKFGPPKVVKVARVLPQGVATLSALMHDIDSHSPGGKVLLESSDPGLTLTIYDEKRRAPAALLMSAEALLAETNKGTSGNDSTPPKKLLEAGTFTDHLAKYLPSLPSS